MWALLGLFIIFSVPYSPVYAKQTSTFSVDNKPATKDTTANNKPATKDTTANNKPATKTTDSHKKSSRPSGFLTKISGSDGGFDPNKPIDFSVVMGPYYSPEVSLGLAFAAVGLYQPDVQSQLSSLVLQGVGSINGSFAVIINNKIFLNANSRQFYVDLKGLSMDVVYYGKGFQENVKDDNLVEYHTKEFTFTPTWKERVYGDIFAGLGADITYSKATEFTQYNKSVVDIKPLQEPSFSVGPSALINYDSRDNVLSATKGLFLEYNISWYDDSIGSDKNFTLQTFHYNQYASVNKTDVVAWQFIGQFTTGDVPWDRMPSIGGVGNLRGYNSGRYQDAQLMTTQVEYRLHLFGRHGMAFWFGVGAIADKISKFNTDELLPNGGLGYRYLIKKNVNMRFDVGYGRNGPGVYLSVNEAF